jgi:hypothetical protein
MNLQLAWLCCVLIVTIPVAASANPIPQEYLENPSNLDFKGLYKEAIDQLIHAKADTGEDALETAVLANLLGKAWKAINLCIIDFLNSSPNANADQLIQRTKNLNKIPAGINSSSAFELEANAIRFKDEKKIVFVVAVNYARRGNVFIFEKTGSNPFRMAWDLKIAAHNSQDRDINVWDDAVDIEGWGSGPLGGDIYPLPKTATGHPRFYLAATTSPFAGGTYTQQISVWEWTGKEAVPQFIKPYSVSLASNLGIQLTGDLLKINLKANLKTFSSCGQCPEPAAIWKLKITPSGVEDIGMDFLQPEYKFIDDLLFRIQKRENIRSMALDRVVRKLRRAIENYRKDEESEMPEYKRKSNDYYLGMLMGVMKAKQQGANRIVSLNIDYLGELQFTFSHRNGKLYALDVHIPLFQ